MTDENVAVVAPASYGQERIWLAAQLAPEANYHVWAWMLLPDGIADQAIIGALSAIAHRHEALRTRLELRDGDLHQVVLKRIEPDVSVRHAPAATREAIMLGQAAPTEPLPTEPFDVTRAPLWRAVILRCGDGDVLLVLAHHAVFDAASHTILERELSALLDDPATSLLPVSPQPVDVASWQRTRVADGELQESCRYWIDRLEGAPGVHGLVLDGHRSDTSGQPGDDLFFRLPEGTSAQAIALGRSIGATEFMVAFAAYAAFLGRVSEDPSVVVGVPASDRDLAGADSAVGMFVNTLPLHVQVDDDPTFVDLVQRVRQLLVDAWKHSAVPLQMMVEQVPHDRVTGAGPLYQLGFNHLGMTGLGRAFGHAKDELFVELSEDDGRLEYRTDLFQRETAERLAGVFGTMFAALVAAPDRPLSDCELETEPVTEWESGGMAERSTPITTVLARPVGDGTRPALTFAGETLSQAQLDKWADAVASRLIEHGVRRGDTVALESARSLSLIPTIIGIMRAGAAYLPVDPDLPEERQRTMCDLAGARLLLDADHPLRQRGVAPTTAQAPRLGPLDAAYVLFTSGSTGEPKGVVNTHGGLAQRLAWMQEVYRLGPGDVVLQKTPTSFDVSVWELLWPAMHDARVVVAEPEAHRDPAAISDLATREGVTVMHFVPSMLRAFLAAGARLPRTVRQVVCSGEALPADVVRDLRTSHPWVAIDNLYGPTEAAIDVTRHECGQRGSGSVSIGRPVPGTMLRVLDGRLRRVPAGVCGQLFIAGQQVARGYADRPGLTAARFVPDPYGAPGSVMYATGDRARWESDGMLTYLGRADDQVKVRGQRIEPAEVSSVLEQVDGVRTAVVLARPDSAGDTTLAAFVLGTASREEIVEAAQSRVPAGFLPSTIDVLEEFPLTTHGKIDRAALLTMPSSPLTDPAEARPTDPRTELAGRVLGAALGRGPLAPKDNFFTLGGHSLAAIRALTALRQEAGVELAVSSLFTHPTPADLATLLPDDPTEARATSPVFAPRSATRVADLDDDEVERALRAALAERSAAGRG